MRSVFFIPRATSVIPLTSFRYVKSAPAEFKDFLEQKHQFNKDLLDLYYGSPDVSPNLPLLDATRLTLNVLRKLPRRITSTKVKNCGRMLDWSFGVRSPRPSTRPPARSRVVNRLRKWIVGPVRPPIIDIWEEKSGDYGR